METKYWNFLKPQNVKAKDFAVEGDWDNKYSQNLLCLGFIKKNMCFSKHVKFAVECDEKSKSFQNVHFIAFSLKTHELFEKFSLF